MSLLAALLPANCLRVTPFAQLAHFPRYLKAMKVRADRWKQSPTKDAERMQQLAPYVAALAKLTKAQGDSAEPHAAEALIRYRWLLEEFRVSLFAQELGTAEPVSAVKLDRLLQELGSPRPSTGPEKPAPAKSTRPEGAVQLPEKKSAPVKNLGALDKLFPR